MQTSPALSGFFVSQLWSRLVPQLSQTESTVRYAVAAVGAAHCKNSRANEPSSIEKFIWQQYNKAIRHLILHLSTAQNEEQKNAQVDLTLITCSLFVCLEMLMGNHEQAFNHLEAGVNLVYRRSQISAYQSIDSQTISSELSDLFSRFRIELALSERPTRLHTWKARSHKDTMLLSDFTDIAHARRSLAIVGMNSLGMIRSSNVHQIPCAGNSQDPRWQEVGKQLRARLEPIEQELGLWAAKFERFMRSRNGRSSDQRAALALRLDHRINLIMSLSLLHRSENEFDRFIDDFIFIVKTANELLRLDAEQSKNNSLPSPFRLEAGVIRTLHWTALKCRDPLTRREAIALMSKYRRKEGVWDWRRSVKITERIVALEEAGLSCLPIEKRIPDDQHRIYATAYFDDSSSEQTNVKICWKPDGQSGTLQQRMETVKWA
ncbi:hypothetical protein PISL3812_08858 [Talaromyces islandicus]|uniref:C6 zinc finger domain protein n=1 Tax=Talaromyces islandicus TaxID=28573 RepID=A0A0U1M838_TALIS|nr:hypothetical protein PISL3812_08858 [Talaromyces islandicus]